MIALWNRLRDFFSRGRLERELDDELRFHQQQAARDERAAGLNDDDARYAARRRLGNLTRIAEETRAMWSFTWLEHLMQDLRYGMRALRRSPGFTIVAVVTLALGIGANTAIFTVINGIVFRPLPYADAGRLVLLWETLPDRPQIMVSYPNYLDWRERTRVFDELALYNPFGAFNLTGMGDAERVSAGRATGNLFDMLGVQAAIGRTFLPEEDAVGANRAVVLTDAMWRRRFGADTTAIGRQITLDGMSYTIVGVLPRRATLGGVDLWVPLGLFAATPQFSSRGNHPGTIGLARLKPGVTLEQMRADLGRVSSQLQIDYPNDNAGVGSNGDFFMNMVVGDIKPALKLLMGAVGLVLLIACVNVANLLLGRAASRQKEMALRIAIGARHGRIVRQLLTESMLLSLIGGVLGVALAWGGVRALLALRPSNVPRLLDIHVDGTVLLFALAVSVITGLVFGVLPALQSASGELLTSLKDSARNATAGRGRLRMRSALMVAEVAIALVLLVGAGLLVRSFNKLTSVDPGVDTRNVIAGRIQLPSSKYPDTVQRRARYVEVLDRAKAIPGVTRAALATDLPTGSSWQSGVTFEHIPVTPGQEPLLNIVVATPEWFETMRMRFAAGRAYSIADTDGSPPVAVISETIARQYFAGKDPIGRRIKRGLAASTGPWLTIVGVVNDVKDGGLGYAPRGTMYLPFAQEPASSAWLAVRADAATSTVLPGMRAALAAVDKDVPLASVQTLDESIAASLAQPRFSMFMFGIFAAIALVLASVGIYGVISYNVAQRTHEIGVRMALGAQRVGVLGMVVRQALFVTGIGIVFGAAVALAAGSLVANLLFGVEASDPATFVAVSLTLASVALVAASVPAWRAMRLDPVTALRGE